MEIGNPVILEVAKSFRVIWNTLEYNRYIELAKRIGTQNQNFSILVNLSHKEKSSETHPDSDQYGDGNTKILTEQSPHQAFAGCSATFSLWFCSKVRTFHSWLCSKVSFQIKVDASHRSVKTAQMMETSGISGKDVLCCYNTIPNRKNKSCSKPFGRSKIHLKNCLSLQKSDPDESSAADKKTALNRSPTCWLKTSTVHHRELSNSDDKLTFFTYVSSVPNLSQAEVVSQYLVLTKTKLRYPNQFLNLSVANRLH